MKLLIVRFSSIGDIVLTTPVLRALREQLPDARIHYLTKKPFEQLIATNPCVDKMHLINESIDEVLSELKAEKFDRIIDLHHNIRTRSLKMKLGVPMASFPKLNFKKWLLVNFKVKRMPEVHVVDRYFKAVEGLGVKNKKYPVEFFIKDEDRVDIRQKFGLEPASYLSVAIGAQFATKRMPEDLVARLLDKVNLPAIIVGGKEDRDAAERIITMSSNKEIRNAAGNFTIAGSASIVQQSSRLLTNDTGMMHIASAFDLPIVSVWGNTVPELGMYPYRPQRMDSYSIHEVRGLSCRPCSKIGFDKCPKGHFKCMKDQDVYSIVKDLNN